MRVHSLLFSCLCLVVGVLAPAACSDPVRDLREASVGPEDPQGPSPDHRRGQDCLVCHDAEGGAKPEMIIAGTVFADPSAGAAGAENVEIEFVDANNGGPIFNPFTLASGNFFVTREQWPRQVFPFKVRLKTENGNVVPMTSTVNREGSCNFCHRPTPPEPYTDQDREIARRSTTQIYLSATPRGGGP
jgi:hypothetical protein